jgi:hypothetical protein
MFTDSMNRARIRTTFLSTGKLSPSQLGIALLPRNEFSFKSIEIARRQQVKLRYKIKFI